MCMEVAGYNGFETVSNRVESVDQRRICTRDAPGVRRQTGTVPVWKQSDCGNW
jgi:hypothetical protein